MRNISYFLLFISLELFISCKERERMQDKVIIQAQYLKGADTVIYTGKNKPLYASYAKGRYKVVFDYDQQENLKLISGTLLGNEYGHQFFFDKEGNISIYYFAVGDNKHSSYELILNDSSLVETGTGFVDYMFLPTIEDSVKKTIRFLFNLFPRSDLNVQYSVDGKDYFQLNQHNSQLMPYLNQADLKIDTAYKKTIFFKIQSTRIILNNTNLSSSRISYDTLLLN